MQLTGPVRMAGFRLREHGTRSRYNQGCRCDDCRKANTAYECWRQKCLVAGVRQPNPFVDAAPVRAHIRKLIRAGVGRRRIGLLAKIPRNTIRAIADGAQKNIRQQSAARILAIQPTLDNRSGNAFVPVAQSMRHIEQLLEEGFTRERIARELGYASGKLQFRTDRSDQITVRNARRIRALHQKYMTEAGQ